MNLLDRLLKTDQEIIEEIHFSFDNAQEELLEQARAIINNHSVAKETKAERLEKLGFVNVESVLKHKKEKQEYLRSKEEADLVEYYKREYPFQKFLKEDQLDAICNKYNLIYAPINKYKKDVPEKNVTEIENSKVLKRKDEPKNTHFLQVHNVWPHGDMPSNLKTILKKGFFVDRYFEPYDSNVLSYAKSHGGYTGNYEGYTVASGENAATITENSKEGLFIAAPKSHFDLKGLKNKGLGFFVSKVTEIKDPIVFRYCKGGLQVLSKWGLEANDPALQNEILN